MPPHARWRSPWRRRWRRHPRPKSETGWRRPPGILSINVNAAWRRWKAIQPSATASPTTTARTLVLTPSRMAISRRRESPLLQHRRRRSPSSTEAGRDRDRARRLRPKPPPGHLPRPGTEASPCWGSRSVSRWPQSPRPSGLDTARRQTAVTARPDHPRAPASRAELLPLPLRGGRIGPGCRNRHQSLCPRRGVRPRRPSNPARTLRGSQSGAAAARVPRANEVKE